MSKHNSRNKYKTIYDAVKAKCKDCCNHVAGEVLKCPIRDCPLWFYRISPDDIDMDLPDIDITVDEIDEMKAVKQKKQPKGRSIFQKQIKLDD